MGGLRQQFFNAVARAIDQRGKPATLGTADGVLYWTDPSGATQRTKVWAQVGEEASRQAVVVDCLSVSPQIGLPVRVDYLNGVLTVVDVDSKRAVAFSGNRPGAKVGAHSWLHSRLGPDPLYIEGLQYLPLLVTPNDTPDLTVKVQGGAYSWSGLQVFDTAVSGSLSSYVPGSGYHFVIVCLDRANDQIVIVDGSDVSNSSDAMFGTATVTASDIEAVSISAAYLPLAAVLLYAGQTQIKARDIVRDLRAAADGGGETPGGSDTQVQFNDGGSFGGDAGLTYNKTTDTLTLVDSKSTPNLVVETSGSNSQASASFYDGTRIYSLGVSESDNRFRIVQGSDLDVGGASVVMDADTQNGKISYGLPIQALPGNALMQFDTQGAEIDFGLSTTVKQHGFSAGYIFYGSAQTDNFGIGAEPVVGERLTIKESQSSTPLVIGQWSLQNSGNVQTTRVYGRNSTPANVSYLEESIDIVSNTASSESGSYTLSTRIGGTMASRLYVSDTEAVINDVGADLDFRVRGDTATHLLVTDAGNNAVRIGDTTAGTIAEFGPSGVVINDAENDSDFRIAGSGVTNGVVYDAGNNRLGIGTATPNQQLEVYGSGATLRLASNSTVDYSQIVDSSASRMVLQKIVAAAAAVIDIDPTPSDGTSAASFRFFRSTNTTGSKRFTVHRGDGTATVDHDFYAGGGYAVGSPSGGDPGVGAISLDAHLNLDEMSSTPSNPTAGTMCNVYMKADKLIIQYNDGGTVRYKYLSLTGTGVSWVHTTTAP